jgi:hypothetical protein
VRFKIAALFYIERLPHVGRQGQLRGAAHPHDSQD